MAPDGDGRGGLGMLGYAPFTRIGAIWQRQLRDGDSLHLNHGAIEVKPLCRLHGERPRPPDPRPEREPPEPSPPPSPSPDDEEEDGDIATPKRDRDDEAP